MKKADKAPKNAQIAPSDDTEPSPLDLTQLTKDLEGARQILMAIGPMLKTPLPHHGPDLVRALTKVDGWLYTCSSGAVKMNGLARRHKGIPTLRVAAEHLEAAVEAIKRRISLGQSVLRFIEAEVNAQLNRVGR